ncbi:MAG: NAD(P)-binding domain-containing protein [Chloroflexi bacterium]|nr:NAD(P)-binding domain-containing protein [Chloroflexota bacterium]
MTTIYYEKDADLRNLRQRQITVIGYGNLGRSIALNLRDSGFDLIVGNREDDYARLARNDGFLVMPITQAAQGADTIFLMIPDETMPQVYLDHIAPNLRTGDMLIFASGYNIAFGYIEPPNHVDAGLIAPRTLGIGVRDGFLNGLGYPCFVAVAQDGSGRAWDYLLALAGAIGALKQGAIEVSFNQEVEIDLFLHQAVLSAIHSTLLTAADVLIREGYPPEVVLTELYLSGELGMLFSRAGVTGLTNALQMISPAGQYGMMSRTERFQEVKMQRQLESILDNIRQGNFAQEWISESADGYPRLKALQRRFQLSPLWRYEREVLDILRGLPPE